MSHAQTITNNLGGDWKGNYGLVPGPGHSPVDRSMSIRDHGTDDVSIHSFAGDDWKPVKDDWRARGWLPDREPAHSHDAEPTTYLYRDADGGAAFRMVRRPGKRFHVEHPDGRGGWAKGMNGTNPLPYRLPELLAAHPDEPVYIVEGEKDADNLAALGLVVTTNPNGAGKWRPEFASWLKRRECIVLPDNDAPGRDHAAKVAASLIAAGIDHVIVDLPGLPDKGDVSDWLAKGGTTVELARLAAEAWSAPAVVPPLPAMLAWVDLEAWTTCRAPPRAWDWDQYIPARQAAYLGGLGGTGKSLLAQQKATCTALGLPFLGVPTRQAVAVYITCEDDPDELHRRQEDICKALGVTMADLVGKLHLVSLFGLTGNELATFDGVGRMATAARWAELRATILHLKAGFVVLDNVAHFFAGNEIIRNQVAAFCGLLNSLARDANAAILLIGHPAKAKDSEYSGSTAWENQFRARLFLEVPSDEHGVATDLDARVLRRSKSNYARTGEELSFRWHKWAFVRDDDLPRDQRAEIAANVQAADENEQFLRMLALATERRRAVSHNKGTNYVGTVFSGMPEGKRLGPAAYARAMERLLSLGKIRLDQPLWQGADRHWKQGIKLASNCGDPPAVTPCGDPREPHSQVIDNACGTVRAGTPLYTTYKSGAAFRASAPDNEGAGTENLTASDAPDIAPTLNSRINNSDFDTPRDGARL